jgi:hypothetical protein
MSRHLPTILDDLFPDSLPEFAKIADAWPETAIVRMLTLVWDGFDRLKAIPNFSRLDFTKNYAQLERSLTDLHAIEVTKLYVEQATGYESFVPHHEPWEFETLSERSARPVSADIGFVLRENARLRWSVEMKVLAKPGDLDGYLGDLDKYVTGKNSPFSTAAALGGYLLQGTADEVFSLLTSALKQTLRSHSSFPARSHRTSEHYREARHLPRATPPQLVCHHLVFSLS